MTAPAVTEAGALDLWLIRSPAPADAGPLDLTVLDEAERKRAASFIRPSDGITYTSAHIALRRLLGAYLGIPAQEVAFLREPCPGCGKPHGRPAVTAPGPPLHFSLSHSHGLALVGVADRPVGVDVERHPRAGTVGVCTPALHPGEQDELDALPEEERPAAFGQLWTRKEAFLKGLGTGLSRGPSVDYLGPDPGRRPQGWTLLDIPCGPRHHGAAALAGGAPATTRLRLLPAAALHHGGTADVRAGAREPAAA
ncbi:4'-phosphopantetheinyl transferase superfamily protein [Streptomyces nondiastaticus]|uniref:4'-phosphopantetheinyl transferase family protein n=1 Tax=Streptomyces nondiastaticus TaxID=3154512 RepID=UPI00344553EE